MACVGLHPVPVTSLEHQALKDEGVVVVVLGSAFERWKASRMSEAAAGVWEVRKTGEESQENVIVIVQI